MKITWILSFLLISLTAQATETAWPFHPLPYAYDALEPHFDAATMEIHYDRHHRAYFNNLLRAAESQPALKHLPLETIMGQISAWPLAVRNNAGGHYNHALFWNIMSPNGGGEPDGMLAIEINRTFGSFEAFKETFNQAATTVFGSGWAWLSVADDGTLFVSATPNQDNPLMDVVAQRGTPILGLDVWEHAYYLKFQNRRGSYIEAFWNIINWTEVSARYRDTIK
jgi:superoxide dismutase, Fe-Mn family